VNAEGVGAAISPEFLQATAQGLLFLVIALWLAIGTGAAWRRFVWRCAGADVRATQLALAGGVSPLWGGWRVVANDVTVDFVGGLHGPSTRVVIGRRAGPVGWLRGPLAAREVPGLLAAPAALELLDALRSPVPADRPQDPPTGA
jgi:hypothetical protein